MKPLRESRGSGYGYWTYEDLIDSMELGEKVVEASSGGYQGDTLGLYRQASEASWFGSDHPSVETYGFLAFGWGSCSGCDSLQACSTIAEAMDLRDELHRSIRWFGDAGKVLKWLDDGDHKLQPYGNWEAWWEFEREARAILTTPGEVEEAIESIQTTIRNQKERNV